MKLGVIKVPISSLYNKPLENSTLDDEILYGMNISVDDNTNINSEWLFVNTFYNYNGYVRNTDISFNIKDIELFLTSPKMVVTQLFADIKEAPCYQSITIISVTIGSILNISSPSNEDGWVEIKLYEGKKGYIKKSFLSPYISPRIPTNEVAFRKNVVVSAKLYLKTQYRWGGKTSLGIDCSGLCSMAYMLNGVIIYRDSVIKKEFPVHKISRTQLKLGDLIYFSNHIAMYIGNNHYIHSTGYNGSDGVVINSLNPQDSDYRVDLYNKITAYGSIF